MVHWHDRGRLWGDRSHGDFENLSETFPEGGDWTFTPYCSVGNSCLTCPNEELVQFVKCFTRYCTVQCGMGIGHTEQNYTNVS